MRARSRETRALRHSLLPASCFLLPASCFLLPASCFLLPASCFLLPASCFLLLASSSTHFFFLAHPQHLQRRERERRHRAQQAAAQGREVVVDLDLSARGEESVVQPGALEVV